MNAEIEAEAKAKLKQLPTAEKIKCCALFKHLKDVYSAQTECDNKNRKIIYDFVKQTNPFLDTINDIVMGNVKLTNEMLEGKEDFFSAEELEKEAHLNNDKAEDFYLKVFLKSPAMKEEIKAHDEPVLKCLKKIEYLVYEDNDNYTLRFHFGQNDFFTNETLEVTVVMDEDEAVAMEIKCDAINWKEGKNVCEKSVTKKQKNKKTGGQRTVTKTVSQESFFHLFKNAQADEEEEEPEDDGEQPELSGFQSAEEVFGTIKDNVVPYSGPAFFGTKIPELEADMYEDDGGEEDDEEDDDYSDEEPEDKKKEKKGKKPCQKNCCPKDSGAEQPKEECKNN